MARQPKPWFRENRQAWFVTIDGCRHNLGPNKKAAFDRFYELMRQPKESKQVASTAFAATADAFLDWVKTNRAEETYEWYRYRLERFCQKYPDLTTADIRPFHVQTWVDSYSELTQTSRRNYVRSVKRCMKWARRQGYIDRDPIADMEVPGAEAREVRVLKEEFETLCSFIRDDTFLELCRVCYVTPQAMLEGRQQAIFDERDRKLAEARQRRAETRAAARNKANSSSSPPPDTSYTDSDAAEDRALLGSNSSAAPLPLTSIGSVLSEITSNSAPIASPP